MEKTCENCKYFKTHTVQRQLFRVYCDKPEGNNYVEYGGYCDMYEPKQVVGGKEE
jgi:hypothetical protein